MKKKNSKPKSFQFLRANWRAGILLFLVATCIYLPSLVNEFIDWDDPLYVTDNPHIRDLTMDTFWWMLSSFHASNWHPLTWLSHAIDVTLWGLRPAPHRFMNILLHGFNTVLAFSIALSLFSRHISRENHSGQSLNHEETNSTIVLGAAFLTALLFGIHPLHVESVVWISERKDLLCAFFFLLSIASYLDFASHADRGGKWGKRYSATLVFFMLALLSKPMAVTLPAVLLLLDFYPLERLAGGRKKIAYVLQEKIPFFLLSFASSLITIHAQAAGGAVADIKAYALDGRIMNTFKAILFYTWKMIWPKELVPLYPLSLEQHSYSIESVAPAVLVTLITAFCVWMWRRQRCFWLTAWLYYLITLLPVLGIVQVGSQAAADRYTYLPSLGPFALAGYGIIAAWSRLRESPNKSFARHAISAGTILFLVLIGIKTVQQTKIWRNSETLWDYVVTVFPDRAFLAYNHLGYIHADRGEVSKAISEYRKALAIHPNYLESYYNLGILYLQEGLFPAATEAFEKTIELDQTNVQAHNNLGISYAQREMFQESIAAFEKSIDLDPSRSDSYYNLSRSFYLKKDLKSALEYVLKAKDLGYPVPQEYLQSIRAGSRNQM